MPEILKSMSASHEGDTIFDILRYIEGMADNASTKLCMCM